MKRCRKRRQPPREIYPTGVWVKLTYFHGLSLLWDLDMNYNQYWGA